MSEFLERAKTLQAKVTSETSFWVRLDLFEGLIAEIERLEVEVRRLARPPPASSIRDINARHQLKEDPS